MEVFADGNFYVAGELGQRGDLDGYRVVVVDWPRIGVAESLDLWSTTA